MDYTLWREWREYNSTSYSRSSWIPYGGYHIVIPYGGNDYHIYTAGESDIHEHIDRVMSPAYVAKSVLLDHNDTRMKIPLSYAYSSIGKGSPSHSQSIISPNVRYPRVQVSYFSLVELVATMVCSETGFNRGVM